MADSERDSSSCILDADEDSRSDLHSPTASEDSVEVQVTPISLRNKRKLAEPRKIQEPAVIAAPLKKRRFDPISEETTVDQEENRSLSTASPFRPWVRVSCQNESKTTASSTTSTTTTMTTMTSSTTTMTTTTTTISMTSTKTSSSEKEGDEMKKEQDETMQRLHESFRRLQHPASHNKSIVSPRRELRQRLFESAAPITTTTSTSGIISLQHPRLQDEPLSLVVRNEKPRVPSHPAVSGTYEKTPSYMMEHLLATSSTGNHQNHQNHRNHQSHQAASSVSSKHQGQQRNYKNMTRERRIEANARERTRVHTISAAFDTLRRAIPAYSHNQKLSKLSVLRIACSYIMTLSKILQENDGEVMTTRNNGPTDLAACVELVSRTIQTEGKLRKRKDD
ncbi:protein atonal-like protein 8 protein [Lasius niger]|uniref:Protein atonal-like protein 8 protein n=1 Tax=Lasius niger TaxID=67767 RepID=A0A0J7P012_LASNI|nr:protein atonal-like protein 8 protein [Lasius niger]